MITIYTKNNCTQCKMAKKIMDRSGVEYEEINIDKNPDYIPFLKEKGIASAPVIFIGNDEDFIVGFQPEKIKKLAKVMVKNSEFQSHYYCRNCVYLDEHNYLWLIDTISARGTLYVV